MNKIYWIFILAAVLFVFTQGRKAKEGIVIDDKSIVIDVRTDAEFQAGHLKSAINIPYDVIQQKIGGYVKKKDESIILYCRSGRRSGIALGTLKGMGYTNVINAGSYSTLK